MKKLIAIALIAMMVLSLAACGSVNETEVSILWSGDGVVHVPNSLINAMERAMYIEKITYQHYGANGDQAVQLQQAKDALDAGCAALVVELVDPAAAQEILDAAEAKNIPVIFFNCEVDEAVVSGYEKAACVISDSDSICEVQSQQIFESIAKEKKGVYSIIEDADRNGDGKISYLAVGDVSATLELLNTSMTENDLPAPEPVAEGADAAFIAGLTVVEGESDKDPAQLVTAEGACVELIISADDTAAKDILLALQAHGFNSTKLKTHCIPVYTVGNDFDYKSFVMETMPAAPYALTTEVASEIEAMDSWWTSAEVEGWKEANTTVCSMYSANWDQLNEFLYTTTDVIGADRLAGTTMVDYDAIAGAVAVMTADLVTGETPEAQISLIPYTTS